jgi:hypothetical protein
LAGYGGKPQVYPISIKTVLISCQQQNFKESHDAVPICIVSDETVPGGAIPIFCLKQALAAPVAQKGKTNWASGAQRGIEVC